MRIHPAIINALQNGDHPFWEIPAYTSGPITLAQEEFERAREMVTRFLPDAMIAGPMDAMMSGAQTLSQIMEIETPLQAELEHLAEQIVRDLFNIPDYIKLRALHMNPMVAGDSPLELGDNIPEMQISDERDDYIQKLANKRIILNGLAHGSSVHIWKTMHYLAAEKINELSPQLMDLYNKYAAAATVSTFLCSADMYANPQAFASSMLQGYNQMQFNDEFNDETTEDENDLANPKIPEEMRSQLNAYGITFPVLLHELNKAAVDYLFLASVPDDLNEEELRYYYSLADKYMMEPWHYMLSTSLWVKLIETLNVETQQLPRILRELADFSFYKLNQLMLDLQTDVEVAKLTLKDLKK